MPRAIVSNEQLSSPERRNSDLRAGPTRHGHGRQPTNRRLPPTRRRWSTSLEVSVSYLYVTPALRGALVLDGPW